MDSKELPPCENVSMEAALVVVKAAIVVDEWPAVTFVVVVVGS